MGGGGGRGERGRKGTVIKDQNRYERVEFVA